MNPCGAFPHLVRDGGSMPKPMFQKVSEDKVKNEIKAIIGEQKLADLEATKSDYVQDFCRLGVLMTDADTCYKALSVLNGLLLKKVKQSEIAHDVPEIGSPRLPKVNDGEVKHYGLLSGFFKAWEGFFGFNAAQKLEVIPDSPSIPKDTVPTLTGFVNRDKFRTHLFEPGYHWKDPGVGWRHGEFTHRVQWYIVTQVNRWEPFLARSPLEIFKMFADNLCTGVKARNRETVWDAVFDRLDPAREDFRTPEIMHTWFKEPAQQDDDHVGILAQLIAGRAMKRQETVDLKEKLRGKQNIIAQDHSGDVMWYQPKDFHPKRVTWDQSELGLK
jgi:hypothetical protein